MINKLLFILLTVFLFAGSYQAQQLNQIGARCPSPNELLTSIILADGQGNLVFNLCPGGSFIGLPGGLSSPLTTKGDIWGYSTTDARIPVGANGQALVADSTQTLGVKWAAVGTGTVTGTGTTNRLTRWTNGAGGVLGDTPLSWDGTTYRFDNTARNSTFPMNFTPQSAVPENGNFTVGDNSGGSTSSFLCVSDVAACGGLPTTRIHLLSADSTDIELDAGQLSTVNGGKVILQASNKGGSAGSPSLIVDGTTPSVSTVKVIGTFVPDTGNWGLGRTLTPFLDLFIGNAATNNIRLVGTATAARVATFPDATGTVQLVGAANTGTVLSVPLANSVLANATGTVFTSPCTTLALASTNEDNVSCPITRGGTIRNLYVRTGRTAAVNSPTTTITIRKNNGNSAVTLTLTETTSTTTSDTTHSFSVVAGDLITISLSVAGATNVSTSIAGITFELD